MKKISYFLLVLALSAFTISCIDDNDQDTAKPVIVLHEPADDDTLFVGHEVHFDAELSDDVMLKSYKVDIHSNFDGHSHAKSTGNSAAWTYSKAWDLTGIRNTDLHHHEIEVPDSINGVPIAKGYYHFSVQVLDEAGNESKVFVDVVVAEGTPHED